MTILIRCSQSGAKSWYSVGLHTAADCVCLRVYVCVRHYLHLGTWVDFRRIIRSTLCKCEHVCDLCLSLQLDLCEDTCEFCFRDFQILSCLIVRSTTNESVRKLKNTKVQLLFFVCAQITFSFHQPGHYFSLFLCFTHLMNCLIMKIISRLITIEKFMHSVIAAAVAHLTVHTQELLLACFCRN